MIVALFRKTCESATHSIKDKHPNSVTGCDASAEFLLSRYLLFDSSACAIYSAALEQGPRNREFSYFFNPA